MVYDFLAREGALVEHSWAKKEGESPLLVRPVWQARRRESKFRSKVMFGIFFIHWNRFRHWLRWQSRPLLDGTRIKRRAKRTGIKCSFWRLRDLNECLHGRKRKAEIERAVLSVKWLRSPDRVIFLFFWSKWKSLSRRIGHNSWHKLNEENFHFHASLSGSPDWASFRKTSA